MMPNSWELLIPNYFVKGLKFQIREHFHREPDIERRQSQYTLLAYNPDTGRNTPETSDDIRMFAHGYLAGVHQAEAYKGSKCPGCTNNPSIDLSDL